MSGAGRVNVRRMVMVRQPAERVYAALRDELPVVARRVPGIDEIVALERLAGPAGPLSVHEWRASSAISPAIRDRIEGGVLTWIERAAWNDTDLESRWTVESMILRGGLTGAGTTRIESAMGGRGCRLHIEISASIAPGALGPLGDGRWKSGIEDAAAKLLAKTLQDLGAGVESFLATTPEFPPRR